MPVKNNAKTHKEKISSTPNEMIQNNLKRLIALSNSPGGDMSKFGTLVEGIVNAKIAPLSGEAKLIRPLITDWEEKVFALIVRRIINESGSLGAGHKFTLGSAIRNADDQYGIGFSAANLIVQLLASRGLVSSLSKAEFGIARDADEGAEPSGIFRITETGVAYAAFFLEKRA